MGLFDVKETKEEKQAKKIQDLLNKYGLNELHDNQDIESIKLIASEMAGNNLIELGTTLSGKAEDVAKMSYLRALIEQNWIIIRQLDRLINAVEK